MIYPLKMVIFHSFLFVYRRVYGENHIFFKQKAMTLVNSVNSQEIKASMRQRSRVKQWIRPQHQKSQGRGMGTKQW